jgi:hypothetical protein
MQELSGLWVSSHVHFLSYTFHLLNASDVCDSGAPGFTGGFFGIFIIYRGLGLGVIFAISSSLS